METDGSVELIESDAVVLVESDADADVTAGEDDEEEAADVEPATVELEAEDGAVELLELVDPPVIVNLGLRLPESPNTSYRSGSGHVASIRRSLTDNDIVVLGRNVGHSELHGTRRDVEALSQRRVHIEMLARIIIFKETQ